MNAQSSQRSFPTSEAVECLDCRITFWSRDVACPGCASTLGIVPVRSDAPAKEIARLRDREAWTTAALLQIAKGSHASHRKARIAQRALEYLAEDELKQRKEKTASASPDAANLTKGGHVN